MSRYIIKTSHKEWVDGQEFQVEADSIKEANEKAEQHIKDHIDFGGAESRFEAQELPDPEVEDLGPDPDNSLPSPEEAETQAQELVGKANDEPWPAKPQPGDVINPQGE